MTQAASTTANDVMTPRAAEAGHVVGDALPEGQSLVDHLVRVARRARAYELLRGAELAPDHRQHVEPGERLPLEQGDDVGSGRSRSPLCHRPRSPSSGAARPRASTRIRRSRRAPGASMTTLLMISSIITLDWPVSTT